MTTKQPGGDVRSRGGPVYDSQSPAAACASSPLGDSPANDAVAASTIAGVTEPEWSYIESRLQLSQRELQLVQAVCSDLTDRAIALRLELSVHTVRTYFDRLFKKLNVRSRLGVVTLAFRTLREQRSCGENR